MSVDATHTLYDYYEDKWVRCRDTAEGSDSVKSKRTKYLLALDSHKDEDGGISKYDEYIQRALFYNAVGRTIDGLSGGIFQKAPSVETTSEEAKEHTYDITLTGEPLDIFALKTTKEILTTGRYGILVDLSEKDATKPRPYWVGYRAEDIVNWRFEKVKGDQQLVFAVLREITELPKAEDEFTIERYTQYRVLRLAGGVYTQQLYVATTPDRTENGVVAKQEFIPGLVITPVRRGVPLDFIPFSLPWTLANPPLLDLAEVNLSHYRGSADLKHGLHFTALPTPWFTGGGNDAKTLSIGGGTAWQLEKDCQAGMLEFTGKGLGAIKEDLEGMQRMMATLGARLLEEAPRYAETALSVSMRHSSDFATLRTLAQTVEQQLTFALQTHCWWLGAEKSVSEVNANIELNKVFFDQSVTADELRALLLALQGGGISYETFYARLQNTGWTREGIDFAAEMKAIESDGDKFKVVKPGLQQPDANPNKEGGKVGPRPIN